MTRSVLLCLALLSICLSACSRTPPGIAMNSPTLVVAFDAIPEEERPEIEAFMQRWSAKKLGDLQYEIPLIAGSRSKATFPVIAQEIQRWHDKISRIRNASGARIPTHDRVIVQLRYISTKAQSESGATITFLARPAGANLFIDTELPGITPYLNEDGSVKLNDARFTIALPFSFIRSTDRIYFYSQFRGSRRYFYYDVARQQQIELTDVIDDAEWDAFKQRRGGR